MKTGTTFIVLCVFFSALFSGCAANRVNLRDAGTVKVEVIPSNDSRSRISSTSVYQDGQDLIITGTVSNQGVLFTAWDGHIDYAVIASDGKAVKLGTAQFHHFPSRRRSFPFTVRFPMIAEKGTVVRLIFHRADSTGSEMLHAAALRMLQGKGEEE